MLRYATRCDVKIIGKSLIVYLHDSRSSRLLNIYSSFLLSKANREVEIGKRLQHHFAVLFALCGRILFWWELGFAVSHASRARKIALFPRSCTHDKNANFHPNRKFAFKAFLRFSLVNRSRCTFRVGEGKIKANCKEMIMMMARRSIGKGVES